MAQHPRRRHCWVVTSLTVVSQLNAETFMLELTVDYGNEICSCSRPTLEHKVRHNDGKRWHVHGAWCMFIVQPLAWVLPTEWVSEFRSGALQGFALPHLRVADNRNGQRNNDLWHLYVRRGIYRDWQREADMWVGSLAVPWGTEAHVTRFDLMHGTFVPLLSVHRTVGYLT
jgi:hypothetical protein